MSSFFDPPSPRPEPVRRQPEWVGPRSNELGAPVAVSVLLARTDDAAVSLGPLTAYRNGFEARVRIRLRNAERIDPRAMHPHGGGEDAFRFGVQFADGRKTTNEFPRHDPEHEPEPPRLAMRGGSGGLGGWEWNFWIWGLPPEGPVTFVCTWPGQNVPESRAEIDAAPILAAAAEAVELWPEGEPESGGGTIAQQIFAVRKDDEQPPTAPPAPPR